jgi:hypothetical protein
MKLPRVAVVSLVLLFASAWCSAEESGESPLLTGTPKPRPVEVPTQAELETGIDRGIKFLLTSQNKDGSWGSATRTKSLNIYAPIPGAHHGFRAATTSLCICALIQTKDKRQEVIDSIQRAEDWLVEELPKVRRATGDAIYNVWAHAYSIEALADLIEYDDSDQDRVDIMRELIVSQIDMLKRYQSVDGGWGYYDFRAEAQQPTSSPTSFTTATGLIALKRATEVDVDVPMDMVNKSLKALRMQRKPDFTYYYAFRGPTGARPMRSINRPGGSLGRSQTCNLALRMWDDEKITDKVFNVWLDRLFARNGWLYIGRKRPVPHESHFLVAGYFYYYGHWYGARTFRELTSDDRRRHAGQMSRLLLDQQEKDGSWWDYPLYNYHQPYGTAMAVMSLVHCRE